jgi:glycosyltransferase involved in cell wall biosynthesis
MLQWSNLFIMLTLSLIIPVYNEERHIRACLDAITRQTMAPYEVIVVDNNCSDDTIAIAKSYDFVRVVHEKKQGRAHARSTGFNTATGDVIGRIDADSELAPNWVERVLAHFENDKDLQGLTGIGFTDIVPYTHRVKSTLFARSYYWVVQVLFRTTTMWGATMAVRSSAWRAVADKTIQDDAQVHEDQDVSLWMAGLGMKIRVVNDVRMTTTGQTYRYLPKLYSYTRLQAQTKRLHKQTGTFSSPEFPKLSLFPLIPGFLIGSFFGIMLAVTSILTYPIDWFLLRKHGRLLR